MNSLIKVPVIESINIKGLQEYFATPDPLFNNGQKSYKHTSEIPLIFYTLHQMAIKAQALTAASGKHYCHDCSAESGKPVYHFNTNHLEEFMIKYKKHLPMLSKVQKSLL